MVLKSRLCCGYGFSVKPPDLKGRPLGFRIWWQTFRCFFLGGCTYEHDSFICDMTHWHDSPCKRPYLPVIWFVHMWSSLLIFRYEWVMWHESCEAILIPIFRSISHILLRSVRFQWVIWHDSFETRLIYICRGMSHVISKKGALNRTHLRSSQSVAVMDVAHYGYTPRI